MAEHSNSLVTVKSNPSLQTNTDTLTSVTTDEEHNEKVYQPVQISESTYSKIPSNLTSIVQSLNNSGGSDTDKLDLLVCLVYVLMIETGFIPTNSLELFNYEAIGFHQARVQTLNVLPQKWKNFEMNSYKFTFILQPFPTRICKMICLKTYSSLTVNLIIDSVDKFSMQINVNKYVPSENCKKIALKFRNLKDISMDLKNSISLPAKNSILRAENCVCLSIENLPTEVLYKIFIGFEVVDFARFCRTCKTIKESGEFHKKQIWKHFCFRDFKKIDVESESVDWKSHYRFMDNKNKRLKRDLMRINRDYYF